MFRANLTFNYETEIFKKSPNQHHRRPKGRAANVAAADGKNAAADGKNARKRRRRRRPKGRTANVAAADGKNAVELMATVCVL